MSYTEITTIQEFENILENSNTIPCFLFKFSPVCPVSFTAQNTFNEFLSKKVEIPYKAYVIDVLKSKQTARSLANIISVPHQSPQALAFKNGKCIWNESHSGIFTDVYSEVLASMNKSKP
ncbi:MAG: bacillithiol system redox-active protein YtxJ [Fibrobacteria bacterium]|nr:bacillithiol system redox-active protein YtxJ [Fibrobacteria bacterium]